MISRKPIVAVIGASKATEQNLKDAKKVGRLIAQNGWTLINGGLGGVMEAASQGATEAGGIVVGLLPGKDPGSANSFVTITIATGMNWGRNAIIAQAAEVLIAIGGSHGTLSELAMAITHKKKVFGLGSWEIEGVIPVKNPQQAIELAEVELKQRNF